MTANFSAYYKTKNAGTRNTGGTAEHPGPAAEQNGTPAEHSEMPTEQQRNTSGPPQNNGTIQNEEQL